MKSRLPGLGLLPALLLPALLLSGAATAHAASRAEAAASEVAGSATSDRHRQLTRLAQDILYTTVRLFPSQATGLGLTQYDAELETPSEQSRAAYLLQLQRWQQRLRALAPPRATLSLLERDDVKLLDAQLAQSLNALRIYQVDRKDYSLGANTIVNCIFEQLQFLPVAGRNGASAASVDQAWAAIMSRLVKAPAYIAAAQRLATRPGHLYGIVGSEELQGAPSLFNGALTQAAEAHYGAASESLHQFVLARDAALAAMAATRTYVDAHVARWPENFAMGRAAYDRMLREELLLPFDSRDIEHMGQAELAEGWAEEAWLTALSRQQQLPFGPQSGGGLAPAGPALIGYYRDRIAELTHFVAAHDLVTLPSWLGTIAVQETPAFMQPVSPGASMIAPRLFASESDSYYFITPPDSLEQAAAHLDMNQDFDCDRILATAAHEAMPGHFLQLSIARRHPDFIRKTQQSSVFSEGWAFYGERMLVRLGLYEDHLDGRLDIERWERVRGARSVVDTKLAAGEWSVREAADFFAAQTGFTAEAAEAAVAGFATNPGYAISYTVGRLQIEQLLGSYMQRRGEQGSLQDFHDRLLSYGSTPLAVVGPELLADLDKPASAVRAAANY
jgi:uncharacterized protein (DUF885 family)